MRSDFAAVALEVVDDALGVWMIYLGVWMIYLEDLMSLVRCRVLQNANCRSALVPALLAVQAHSHRCECVV